MSRRIPVLLVALAALGPAPAADAALRPDLWATINVCDTPTSPDKVGVRASMPGDGTGKRMYARFELQYYSQLRQGWFPVRNAVSPRALVGSARHDRQAGYTFSINPPAGGGTFNIRGIARLEWASLRYRTKRVRVRRGRRVVMVRRRVGRGYWVVVGRSTQISRGGLPNVQGGDPVGTSLATCQVT